MDSARLEGIESAQITFLRVAWALGEGRFRVFRVRWGKGLCEGEVDTPLGSTSDTDASFAAYQRGGVAAEIVGNLEIGIDLRLVAGSEVEVLGIRATPTTSRLACG